jgi:predicted RecB family nuclease
MDAWRRSLALEWSETRIVHWSPAEPNLLANSHNSAEDRHPTWRLPADLGWFDALDGLVHRVPVGVVGAWGYGLKAIAKGMHQAGLIATVWADGPADGLGAMAAAYEADRRAAQEGATLYDYDFLRATAAYNEVDCRAMAEVVEWLRANR